MRMILPFMDIVRSILGRLKMVETWVSLFTDNNLSQLEIWIYMFLVDRINHDSNYTQWLRSRALSKLDVIEIFQFLKENVNYKYRNWPFYKESTCF